MTTTHALAASAGETQAYTTCPSPVLVSGTITVGARPRGRLANFITWTRRYDRKRGPVSWTANGLQKHRR
jgi:hypothetical protein